MEDVKPAAAIDLHRDGTPIYVQLAGLFRRRIESGEWPVGAQIPTLDALALEFGVARATIRQTTGLLRQEGLLARYRGRGTIVLRRPQREFWYEVGADWDSMIAAYRHDGFGTRILDTPRRRAAAARLCGRHAAATTIATSVASTRIGNEPAAVDGAWLNAGLRPRIDEEALRSFPTLAAAARDARLDDRSRAADRSRSPAPMSS